MLLFASKMNVLVSALSVLACFWDISEYTVTKKEGEEKERARERKGENRGGKK